MVIFYRHLPKHLLLVLGGCIWLSSCIRQQLAIPYQVYNTEINRQLWSADWSGNGRFIATGGVDSTLYIYHAPSLRLYKSFACSDWIHVVRWHPDNRRIAIGKLDQDIILLDVITGDKTILAAPVGTRAMEWNHDGSLLASGDLNGQIHLWNDEGQLLRQVAKTYHPDQAGTAFLGVDWHPFENKFVLTNYEIALYDTTGTLLRSMQHTNPAAIILCVAWHPTGDFFVIGDYGYNWDGEHVPSLLHFWSHDGKYIKNIEGSKGEYRNIAWNHRGTHLATASDVLRVWSLEGRLLHSGPQDQTNFLWGIDWNPKGNRIVTSSRHETVSIWNANGVLKKRIDPE